MFTLLTGEVVGVIVLPQGYGFFSTGQTEEFSKDGEPSTTSDKRGALNPKRPKSRIFAK